MMFINTCTHNFCEFPFCRFKMSFVQKHTITIDLFTPPLKFGFWLYPQNIYNNCLLLGLLLFFQIYQRPADVFILILNYRCTFTERRLYDFRMLILDVCYGNTEIIGPRRFQKGLSLRLLLLACNNNNKQHIQYYKRRYTNWKM